MILNKSALKQVINDRIKNTSGKTFQQLFWDICGKIYEDLVTPDMNHDLGSDAYSLKNKKFFASWLLENFLCYTFYMTDFVQVEVRKLNEADLEFVEKAMPSQHHKKRLNTKNADYLVAWADGKPVGHLLLRWSGSDNPFLVAKNLDYPYLEAVSVKEDFWSRGIGTQLMQKAQDLVNDKGFDKIGVSVGLENEKARNLYEKLGYLDSGFGEFEVSWSYVDESGEEKSEVEICVYLVKELK